MSLRVLDWDYRSMACACASLRMNPKTRSPKPMRSRAAPELPAQVMLSRWAGRVKMLLLVREPADYLWSAYNFWVLPGEPRSSQDDWTDKGHLASPQDTRRPSTLKVLMQGPGKHHAWTAFIACVARRAQGCFLELGGMLPNPCMKVRSPRCFALSRIHKRSPEHFHELVLADGKMPAWQPRASKVTGLWFDLVIGIENISTNILVLKSEDHEDCRACRHVSTPNQCSPQPKLLPRSPSIPQPTTAPLPPHVRKATVKNVLRFSHYGCLFSPGFQRQCADHLGSAAHQKECVQVFKTGPLGDSVGMGASIGMFGHVGKAPAMFQGFVLGATNSPSGARNSRFKGFRV